MARKMRPFAKAARVVALLTLIGGTAAAQDRPSFVTPSGNIQCFLDNNASDLVLHCMVRQSDWAETLSADECDADQSGVVSLPKRAQAEQSTWCYSDVFWPYPMPVLGYGSTWSVEGYSCSVNTDGVRCSDDEGTGAFHVKRSMVKVE